MVIKFILFLSISFVVRVFLFRFLVVFANIKNGEKFKDVFNRGDLEIGVDLNRYFLIMVIPVLSYGLLIGYLFYFLNFNNYFPYFISFYLLHLFYNFYKFFRFRYFFIRQKKEIIKNNPYSAKDLDDDILTDVPEDHGYYMKLYEEHLSKLKNEYYLLVNSAGLFFPLSIVYIISFSISFLYLYLLG